MGRKGDRPAKEPLARDLYAQGKTLDEIAGLLDISRQALSSWKAESQRPGEEWDDWELSRRQRRGVVERLRSMLDEQLEYLQGLRPDERSSPLWDSVAKLMSVLEKFDRVEKAQRAAEAVTAEVRRAAPGLSEEAVELIRRKILGVAE